MSTTGTTKNPSPLNARAFPKTCVTCNAVYLNEIDFFQRTTPISNTATDIKVIKDDEENDADIFLEVFRNCACGSTLMELFHCRRDLSENGIRKRIIFETLLDGLVKIGHDRMAARTMILEFIALYSDVQQSNSTYVQK